MVPMKITSIILAIAITFGCYAKDEIVNPICKVLVSIPYYHTSENEVEDKYLELFQEALASKNYGINFAVSFLPTCVNK